MHNNFRENAGLSTVPIDYLKEYDVCKYLPGQVM